MQETIRTQRLQLSILVEQMGNNDKTNSTSNIAAIIVALQTIQTAITAATNVSTL